MAPMPLLTIVFLLLLRSLSIAHRDASLLASLDDNIANKLATPSNNLNKLATSLDDDVSSKWWPCPPCICFHCAKAEFPCLNGSSCVLASGVCEGCPIGLGGDDCGRPLCGSLISKERPFSEKRCECDPGWSGLNCNVCVEDGICSGRGGPGVCHQSLFALRTSYKTCKASASPLIDLILSFYCVVLPDLFQRVIGSETELTAECHVVDGKHSVFACSMQFWVGQDEQFWCSLEECMPQSTKERDIYVCGRVECHCVPKAKLCSSSLFDIRPILSQVKGPAEIGCNVDHESLPSQCSFTEPKLNEYIAGGLKLECVHGECMLAREVPGAPIPSLPWSFYLSSALAVLCSLTVAVVSTLFLRALFTLQADVNTKGPLLPTTESTSTHDKQPANDASFDFVDISYRLETSGERILKGISGSVQPGQMLAIIGGSGAGKTTCLEILAKKAKSGTVTGQILVRGDPVGTKELRVMSGFVSQEDTLLGTLTVRETLMYSALLRLPAAMSFDHKLARVADVMTELGIEHLADSLIGIPGKRGLSGGEKRRVSIAQELVTDPHILFLDEPTSGLDAHSAFVVVETLSRMAREHSRVIICSIHQPRSNVFAMFDKMLLLAQGRMLYSGPVSVALNYFAEEGFTCPVGYNAADFLVDLSMTMDGEEESDGEQTPVLETTSLWRRKEPKKRKESKRVRDLADRFASRNALPPSRATHSRRPTVLPEENNGAPYGMQFMILSARSMVNLYRNPLLLIAHYAVTVLLAVFIGSLFWSVSNDLSGVQNRLGCLFFVCAFFGFSSLTALEFFADERLLFCRERSNGFYAPSAYFWSKAVIFDLVPLRILPPIAFGSIVYWMVGLYPSWTAFLKFLLILTLFNVSSAAFALVAAAFISERSVANLTASLGVLFAMLFGGFLLNKQHITWPLSILPRLSHFNYAFEALVVNELTRIVLRDTDTIQFDIPGTLILRQFGFDSEAYLRDAFALIIMGTGVLGIAFLGIRFFVKERR